MSSKQADDSFSRLGLHVGADWLVRCCAYSDRTPILDVDAGSVSIGICIRSERVDEVALNFARALVREVQVFAAEVERLHAGQTATDDNGNGKAADVHAA